MLCKSFNQMYFKWSGKKYSIILDGRVWLTFFFLNQFVLLKKIVVQAVEVEMDAHRYLHSSMFQAFCILFCLLQASTFTVKFIYYLYYSRSVLIQMQE